MDVYLEDPAFWPDFHHRFIEAWCDAVADQLPDSYEARLNERVNLVQMSPEVVKLIYPDVSVSHGPRSAGGGTAAAGTVLLEPVTIPHEFLEEVRESHVEILHRPERSLVAVLELRSPTNKTSEGFDQYCAKRKEVLRQRVHLVELDLLLNGTRLPLSQPLPAGDYFGLVSRAERHPDCEVYHWSMRDRLPGMPIPLRAPDADIRIDLQALFQAVYDRGRYARSLSYGRSPVASMNDDDAHWAMSFSRKTV